MSSTEEFPPFEPPKSMSAEAFLLEQHIAQRIQALREDIARAEARLDAKILINSGRLSSLEQWQYQMIGMAKVSRILWIALVAVGAAISQMVSWIMTHWGKHS